MPGWKIDRDYLHEKWNREGGEYNSVSRVGAEAADEYSEYGNFEKIRFRLKDDDDEIYYGGWLLDDPDCFNQESALSYGTYDAGCTIIEVKRNGEWVQEIG